MKNRSIVHRGGKLSEAARCLAKSSSSKRQKSVAGQTLANHKAKYHK